VSKLKSISSAASNWKIKQKMKITIIIQKNKLKSSDISSLSKVMLSAENKVKFLNK
jgi:hypothetical protein